jgi:hypothetical protein
VSITGSAVEFCETEWTLHCASNIMWEVGFGEEEHAPSDQLRPWRRIHIGALGILFGSNLAHFGLSGGLCLALGCSIWLVRGRV